MNKLIIISLMFSTLLPLAAQQDTVWSEEPPVCINLKEIMETVVYPNNATEAEGKVTIKLLIDENGNVEKTGSMSGPEIFYNEVKRVAVNLKFTPAKINGYSFKCWVTVPFKFQIK